MHLMKSFSTLLILLISLGLTMGTSEAKGGASPASVARAALQVWRTLGSGNLSLCPDHFEYFPHSGPQQVACYLRSLGSMSTLIELAPTPIFASGPHLKRGETHFDLQNSSEFGHYNPEFIQWVNTHVLPILVQPQVVKVQQANYDTKLKPFLRELYATYRKIDENPQCFLREVEDYRKYIQAQKEGTYRPEDHQELPYERYYFFLNPYYCSNPKGDFQFFSERGYAGGDHDGNVVKGCASWWIRRELDGTLPLFKEALEKFISAYDSQFVSQYEAEIAPPLPKPPLRIDRPSFQVDRAAVFDVLSRFEESSLAHQAEQLKSLMDERYVREQHDQFLQGRTAQFIDEFFCGPQESESGRFTCIPFRLVRELQLVSLQRSQESTWNVRYKVISHPEGQSTKSMTVILDFKLVKTMTSDGRIRYALLGSAG